MARLANIVPPAEIGLIDNFSFVFSRASNKNVPFPVPIQSHFNQSGEVSIELLTNHQKAWLPD